MDAAAAAIDHPQCPRFQEGPSSSDSLNLDLPPPKTVTTLNNILLPSSPIPQAIQISASGRVISMGSSSSSEDDHEEPPSSNTTLSSVLPVLALPSLCHPHVHLDKPHLLTHPQTAHLSPETGSFPEALSLTAQAKEHYTRSSLIERGNQLIADSVRAGVTHMRAFAEVDTTVGLLCVETGLELKRAWATHAEVQICAFAQDPLFTNMHEGNEERKFVEGGNDNLPLLLQALKMEGVDVLGSTPYVEVSDKAQRRNIHWAVSTAIERNLQLDLHLDYNLDPNREAMVWTVLGALHACKWNERQADQGRKTVVLGHCTRLTLFSAAEWARLASEIGGKDLPVYFVGLPTSDLFMQGRPPSPAHIDQHGSLVTAAHGMVAASNRPRSTLHVPSLLDLGLKCALSINNVGNAFTPLGTADPLLLACWGVGVYQVGTIQGVRNLYGAVSWMAREAIGLEELGEVRQGQEKRGGSILRVTDRADLVLFGDVQGSEVLVTGEAQGGDARRKKFQRVRRSVEEVVWDPSVHRTVLFGGKIVTVE